MGMECRFLHQLYDATTDEPKVPPNPKPVQRPRAERVAVARPKMEKLSGRDYELKQLKTRFPVSFKMDQNAEDGLTRIEVGIPPSDPDFPFDLETLLVKFTVSDEYPTKEGLKRAEVMNEEIPDDIRLNISMAIMANSREKPQPTLLQLTNWIDRFMEKLLSKRPPEEMHIVESPSGTQQTVVQTKSGTTIKIVGRPTNVLHEVPSADDMSEISDDQSESEEKMDIAEEGLEAAGLVQAVRNVSTDDKKDSAPIQRGTQIRFPGRTMKHIALIECISLHLLLQCVRCKNSADLPNVMPHHQRTLVCGTCKSVMELKYRPEPMHAKSESIGFLDLDSCVAVDMLPSTFLPTCSECLIEDEDVQQFQFKRLAQGVSQTISCVNCHTRMTFAIDYPRFFYIGVQPTAMASPTTMSSDNAHEVLPSRKKKTVKEPGIVPGQALPEEGTCKHYRKSFRWLRFPCCGRAFPCDDCHQDSNKDGHEMVLANRMICGFCSREQPFSNAHGCTHCGNDLTKSSSGKKFWEGGQGVRDPNRLSKNDARKFRGLGKTISRKAMNKK